MLIKLDQVDHDFSIVFHDLYNNDLPSTINVMSKIKFISFTSLFSQDL